MINGLLSEEAAREPRCLGVPWRQELHGTQGLDLQGF